MNLTDPNKEYKISKQDVDSGKFYTKKQYVYRNLAYWAISSGKLNEAIKYMNISEEEAAKVMIQNSTSIHKKRY